MTTAGDLRFRVRFDKKRKVEDAGGAKESDWEPQFDRWADIRPLKGSEPVIAQRLTGVQPTLIIVYFDSRTSCVTEAWRAVEIRSGKPFQYFAIKSVGDMERESDFMTFLCERGASDA